MIVGGTIVGGGQECRELLFNSPSPLPLLIERQGQLKELSLDTVKMFAVDAKAAGFSL